MKALLKDNIVVDISASEFPVHPSLSWMDAPEQCQHGWVLLDGVLQPQPIPDKTIAELLIEFKFLLQEYIDKQAGERDYSSGFSCASYANSSIEIWQQEALAFIAWRDAVWSYSYVELAKFQNDEREAVTFEEFLTELPTMVWPNI